MELFFTDLKIIQEFKMHASIDQEKNAHHHFCYIYTNAIIRNKLIKQINSTHATIVRINNFGHRYINVFFCFFDQREADLKVLVIWQIDVIETMVLSHHLTKCCYYQMKMTLRLFPVSPAQILIKEEHF